MKNFSISTQIEKELEDFRNKKVKLAVLAKEDENVRFAKNTKGGTYFYNQGDTINLIDLYYNSKFENGEKDNQNQSKIFLNVGKFRTDVSAKQIDIDTSNFKFIQDDYADPWTAIFMQKDFKEWSKETYFGDLVNDCVDNFPKYGSLVLKKVKNKICFVPLQTLYNEQTAESLQTASYVIEEHADMTSWEIQMMESKGWIMPERALRFDETANVFERYGHVPLAWLKLNQKEPEEPKEGDENIYVDAMVIAGDVKTMDGKKGWHTFFASKITERPYREAHWNKQHGRWLGVGVMEDLFQNQVAKNILVNLLRRAMQWSSKRIFQSATTDASAKNLIKDVPDGAVLEVGRDGGDIREVVMNAKSGADWSNFMNEFDRNSDQKAFTYEVATGESLPSGTPFRLGVVLSNSVNSFFKLKQEKLGLFLKKVVIDFLVPQFIKDMSNEERVVSMFSGEAGFEVLKKASMDMIRSEAARITMLSGVPVDISAIESAIEPFKSADKLFFKIPKNRYKEAKYKFDLVITGEEIDLESKLETLKTIATIWQQKGDPRAEKVVEKIASLAGENVSQFGPVPETMPQVSNANIKPNVPTERPTV